MSDMKLSDILKEISDQFKRDNGPRSALNFKTLSDQAKALEDRVEELEEENRQLWRR